MRRPAAVLLSLLLLPPLRAGEVLPPGAPSPGTQPVHVDEKIVLEVRKTHELSVEGLQSLLVVDPSVVEALPAGGEKPVLLLRALAVGGTYVVLWTLQGRRALQVQVVPFLPKSRPSDDGRGLTVRHSLEANAQEVRAGDRRDRDAFYTYALNADGRTPLGRTQVQARADDFYGESRLAWLSASAEGGWGRMRAGDVFSELSLLSSSLLSFQGGDYRSPDGPVQFRVLGGNLNSRYWGRQFLPVLPRGGDFSGGRVSLRPGRSFEAFATGTRALDGALADDRRKNASAGLDWQPGGLVFKSEAARGPGGEAWYADAGFRSPRGGFIVTRRDVEEGYVTVSGGAWERGRKGTAEQLQVQGGPFKQFTLTHDAFIDRYQPNPLQPRALNRDIRAVFTSDLSSSLSLRQDAARRRYPGLFLPRRESYYRTEVAGTRPGFQPFGSFRREHYDRTDQDGADYAESAWGVGARWRSTRLFSASSGLETVRSRRLATGDMHDDLLFGGGIRLAVRLGPWTNTVFVDYQERHTRFAEKSARATFEERLEFSPSQDLRFFAMGRLDRNVSQSAFRQATARVGVEWVSRGLLPWTPARSAAGCVFTDLNGDGARQADEPGIPGLTVMLNGERRRRTDAKGCYRFPAARGELSVSLDIAGLPPRQRLSSSNPQVFGPSPDGPGAVRADFGVMYRGEASGYVSLDVDDDGRIGPGDKPMPRVRLSLDGRASESTDRAGRYVFSGVSPGDHELALDVLTLPPDMVAETASRQNFSIKEGERAEVSFLIRPMRFLSGRVFWDKNGNGTADAGEPGVKDVLVSVGGVQAASDKDGFYYVNPLRTGDTRLTVDPPSLGRRWSLPRGFAPSYSVPGDAPFIKENVDIPLRKR